MICIWQKCIYRVSCLYSSLRHQQQVQDLLQVNDRCTSLLADFSEARQAAMQEALANDAIRLQACVNRWLEKYPADCAENVAIR